MKIYVSIFLFSCAFSLSNCKKTTLKDNYAPLIGEWRWIGGYDDGGDESYKLDLKEKGKYKLYIGTKKIEYGRLVLTGGYLKFYADNFLKGSNKNIFFNRRDIEGIYNDTIYIHSVGFVDVQTTYLKKIK